MALAKYSNENILEIRSSQKCGSTTIHSLMRDSLVLDYKVDDIRPYFLKKVYEYKIIPTHKIVVIRDPIARLISVYSDRVLKKNRNGSRNTIKDWNDFIVNLEKYRSMFPDINQHSRPQKFYIGELDYYDKIFFTRDLKDKIPDYIFQVSGVKVNPLHKKSSNSESKNIVVTDKQKDLIKKYYKEDYELLKNYIK